MIIDSTTSHQQKTIKEMQILVDNSTAYEVLFNEKNVSDLPFYCFDNSTHSSQIEELNFNNLKKCNDLNNIKHMLVFLKSLDNITETRTSLEKKFNEWHTKNNDDDDCKNIKIVLTDKDNQTIYICGKMKKIFYKGFSPETNNSSNP